MKRFSSIEWLDNAIPYTLELIASVSVLFLTVGLIASIANVLTGGEVISNSGVGKQFYARSQAIGIDASIPGVILRLALYTKQKVSKQKSVQLIQQSVQPEQPVVKKDRTSKEPTPINENLERVKAYLADHPNAAAREVGRALGLSATSAAKWVKRLKETA